MSAYDHEDPKATVARAFDQIADAYARLEAAEWPRMRRLREVLMLLAAGSDVLDLGCGSAAPAGPVIAREHRLTGVDISAEQIARARRNVPEGMFVQDDMASVAFRNESFDAVVSFYAFDQVPREEWPTLLARIYRWLRPGGYLLVSVEDSDDPGRFGQWLGVRMFFSSHEAGATEALVRAAGFEVISAEVEEQVEQGPTAAARVPYFWVLARRSA
jgi:cyclopropane fatty-acyl-phospholipid synthase-like methyltransferase